MASKKLFASVSRGPIATVKNNAGGAAYKVSSKQALAMIAVTGCFADTYYTKAEAQLDKILALCKEVPPEFIAKLAVYSRTKGLMKDMPAFLLAYLATVDTELLKLVFNKVIDNGKMLKNFVQIIRSGTLGRKSFGSAPKKLIQKWLNARRGDKLLWDNIGNDPSLADVIKMVHVHPVDPEHEAMFGYIIGAKYNNAKLPRIVRQFEDFKAGRQNEIPKVDMRLLTSIELTKYQWQEIAALANWTTTRMNLNTFLRHGVFDNKAVVKAVADRLADRELVLGSKCFPYQLLTTYQTVNRDGKMPVAITNALQDAMEHATRNVPSFVGKKVVVCPDVSQSMQHPVTGSRHDVQTVTRCIDVAALIAAVVSRNNDDSLVIPFEGHVVDVRLNPRDSVMTNAAKLASINGRATKCAAPLIKLNAENTAADLIIFISDNESWINGTGGFGDRRGKATEMMNQWKIFKRRNPNAKLVCIDIAPGGTTQVLDDESIMNVAGFSDNVFKTIHNFVYGDKNAWANEVGNILLEAEVVKDDEEED